MAITMHVMIKMMRRTTGLMALTGIRSRRYCMSAAMCSVYYLVLNCIQIEELHEWKKGKEEEKEKEQMDEDIPDQFVIYKQILELLRPGETVVKVTD